MFDPGAMFLQWEAVAGATEYRVLVSQNSDMSDPVINDVTTKANHAPFGLSGGATYYWQVFASDSEGNMGIGSQIWSFTTPANISPVAQISIPAKGGTCIVGQEYEFSGSGNDSEDGVLSGASLVWTSDVAGPIGTGETCSWRPLDDTYAGTHKITLTASDSEGATGADSVVITVATGRLPDTGQEQLEGYEAVPGEDMTYRINPPTYTKLDKEGNDLAADAINWAMARNDVTGLIWEVKTDDDTIHDRGNGYSWQGALDDFIAELNQEGFGGYNDWRLPTIKELSVMVHRGLPDRTMHPVYFPNVISNFYWTATTNANNTDEAWTVIFQDGTAIYNRQKLEINYVRAVRGGL